MKFTLNDFIKRGWLMAPDEQQGGGDPDPTAPESVQAETAGSAPDPNAAPATITMTPEEFDAALAKASAKALSDSKAEQARALQESQAREAEVRRRQAAAHAGNPQTDALEAMDLRSDMLEEALTLHPDMPLEARQQLKDDLRAFKTVDHVRAAKDSGLHVKLADAAAGNAIRSGKYTPKNLQTPTVMREPVHSEPARTSVPDWYRKEMETEFASMRLKITEKEIAEAYAADAR